ncbi:DUF2306 domain-containing protein [Altererythrobacter salegens]|uniref:DUF2306 domain-containing protein n=1 Tax=Croceibacterium salegens TaxID=1737568 RepID=A0A6I4SSX9_9SPHN|nr:DUF2306 domain-containing protein [Croceibacterium salegens]MXO59064.1 DUF2306 domain-containing protein [Croceibacterium salegens]
MATIVAIAPRARPAADQALRWSLVALTATAWLSGAIFGAYILAYYVGAVPAGTMQDWNSVLPRLYEAQGSPAANMGIGVHFMLGAVLLLLGPLQLIAGVRTRWPRFHHWVGRTYVASAILTGIGGLTFIALRGTVGGLPMSIAFALYGAAMVVCGAETLRHAMARRLQRHRAWAIRLFALAVGSWLYRMDYGFWFLLFGKAGHTADFHGPFDYFMDFWFYLPNLLVAELAIRSTAPRSSAAMKWGASGVIAGVTAFLVLAAYFFTTRSWGVAILWRLGWWA